MSKTVLTFDGISSDDMWLTVERVGAVPIPVRKMKTYSVPGRNGDYTITEDAFENVILTYDFYYRSEAYSGEGVQLHPNNVQQGGGKIAWWLFRHKGYQQLKDSNDPLYYREAYAVGGFDVDNILRKYGKVTITFVCKPQRFRILTTVYEDVISGFFGAFGWLSLKNGVLKQLFTSEVETATFPTNPYFIILNGGDATKGTLEVNGTSYLVDPLPSGGIVVDTERQQVYNLTATQRKNASWQSADFPQLDQYREDEDIWFNDITLTTDSPSATEDTTVGLISPRWWTL